MPMHIGLGMDFGFGGGGGGQQTSTQMCLGGKEQASLTNYPVPAPLPML